MNTRTYIAAALTTTGMGCADTESVRTFVETDSAGIAIVSSDTSAAAGTCAVASEPTVTIGSATGGPEHELYRVFGAARLSDGSIALVNQGSQQLRVYDESGDLVRASGREGRGPGEFADVFFLWVLPGDTIWVGDSGPRWQFLVFAPDGSWRRTIRPEPVVRSSGVREVFADGRFLLAERPLGFAGENWSAHYMTVILYDRDGAALDTFATLSAGRRGKLEDHPLIGLYPLFESVAHLDANGSTFVVAHGAEPEYRVYEVADTIALRRIVRWTTGDRTVTDDIVAAERASLESDYAALGPRVRQRLGAPLISEQRPVAEQLPAFTALRVGRDGRVWIRNFVRPGERTAQRWLAFDTTGRYTCRLELAEEAEVLEYGADYVILEDIDELGVERVALYRITIDSLVQ